MEGEETEILVDVIAHLSRQVRTLAQTLHEDEVREGCKGDTTERSPPKRTSWLLMKMTMMQAHTFIRNGEMPMARILSTSFLFSL